MTSSSLEFVNAMASGTALVAVQASGTIMGHATAAVASYSIDPPSVIFPAHPRLADLFQDRFGISLLEAGQADVAKMAWHEPVAMPAEMFGDGIPVVAESIAQLICSPLRIEVMDGGSLVIAEVTDVTLGSGMPLIWDRRQFVAIEGFG